MVRSPQKLNENRQQDRLAAGDRVTARSVSLRLMYAVRCDGRGSVRIVRSSVREPILFLRSPNAPLQANAFYHSRLGLLWLEHRWSCPLECLEYRGWF